MPISLTGRSESRDVNKTASISFVKVQTAVTRLHRLIQQVAIAALKLFVALFSELKERVFFHLNRAKDKASEGQKDLLIPTSALKSETVELIKGELSNENTGFKSPASSSPSQRANSSPPASIDQTAIASSEVLVNPARAIKKAQLAQATKGAFANFYPKTWVTEEAIGNLGDAFLQIEKDIPRAKVSIGGERLSNFDAFAHLLDTTPFAPCRKQLAELMSQGAIAPTCTRVMQEANARYEHCIGDSEGLMVLNNQHGHLEVDFHPEGGDRGGWIVEGTITMHLSLVHPLFANGGGYYPVAERLKLHFAAKLPIELIEQSLWRVSFDHSAVVEQVSSPESINTT